jgi:thiamine-phosphate pyrophosphorylase
VKIIGVTQRSLCTDFYKRIEEISKYKLDYLILREKDLNSLELENMALRIKSILADSNIKLFINGNAKVAISVNADGLQLSFKDFCKEAGVGFHGVIGVSIHSLEEALIAEKKGANHLIYGHIYQTDCKKGLAPRGIDELKIICQNVNIPVFAIGGINQNNFRPIIEAGASGVALMSSLMKGEKVDGYYI